MVAPLPAHAYLAHLPVCHWVAQASDLRMLAVGPEATELTGCDPSDFVAGETRWLERVHGEDRPSLEEVLRRPSDAPRTAEFRFRGHDERERWLRATFRDVAPSGRQAALIVGVFNDVSAERNVAEGYELFQGAVEHADVALTLLDLDGRIIYVNAANAELMGRPAGEMIGRHVSALVSPEKAGDTEAMLETLRRAGAYQREGRAVRGDGTPVYVAVSAETIRDAEGRPICIVATVRDLRGETERFERLGTTAITLAETGEEDLATTIARLGRSLVGARYAALSLLDPAGVITGVAADGMSEDQVAAIGSRPRGRGLLGAVIAERRTIRVRDVGTDPRGAGLPPRHPAIGPFLGTPLVAGESAIACLYLANEPGGATFSFMDERLIELFGTRAAAALREGTRVAQLEATVVELQASRPTETLLARLIDASSNEVYVADAETLRILEANTGALRNLGYDLDELTRMTPLDLVPGATAATLAEWLDPLLSGEREQVTVETFLRRRDGTTYPVECHFQLHAAGDSPLLLVLSTDISERRAAQQRLAAQFVVTRVLAESRTLAEAGPRLLQAICQRLDWEIGDVWIVDPAAGELRSGAVWHSPALEVAEFIETSRATRFTPGVGLPGHVWAAGAARWVADVVEDPSFVRHDAAAAAGIHAACAFPVTAPDGDLLGVIDFLSREVRPPDPALMEVLADIGRQVGQFVVRERAEAERARLAAAVEHAADSIAITDAEGTIVYVNPAFSRVSGYPAAEALGRNPRFLKSGRHDAAFFEAMWATLLRGETWSGSVTNRRRDGTLYEAEAVISPVRDAAGRISHFVEAARDITHERELEAQLRAAQKLEAVGSLAGGIAHDFNNILTAIGGHARLLLEDLPTADPRRGEMAEVIRGVDRATDLTRQLLAFGRRQMLRPEVVDPNAVVDEIVPMLRRLIREDIVLSTALAADVGHVRVDRSQLEQVLLNLVVNARDAMPEGGRLLIETAGAELDDAYAAHHAAVVPGRYVMLAVSDTGTGMDAETRDRIFEPFFTTKGPGEGTGLGLATVYGIVKQSDGYIWVYSEPGTGTTFKIYLPRADEPITATARDEPPAATVGGSETVLVVEDEPAVRALIGAILRRQGYTVLEADKGTEAFSIARTHPGPIALLVTDVVMPGMSGDAVAALVKGVRPGLPVLYLSGYTENAIVHHGVLEERVEFLHKPFSPDALARKVRQVLDTPREGS